MRLLNFKNITILCFILLSSLANQSNASNLHPSSLRTKLTQMCASQVCHSANSVTTCASFIKKSLQCSNNLCSSASIFEDCVADKCSPSQTENNFWSCISNEENLALKEHFNKKNNIQYENEDSEENEFEDSNQSAYVDSQLAKKKKAAKRGPAKRSSASSLTLTFSVILFLALSF